MDELHAAKEMLYGPWFPMAEFCLVRDWILIEVTDEQRALLEKIRVTDCVSAPRWEDLWLSYHSMPQGGWPWRRVAHSVAPSRLT